MLNGQIRSGRLSPVTGKSVIKRLFKWTVMVNKGGTAEASVPCGQGLFLCLMGKYVNNKVVLLFLRIENLTNCLE